MNNPQGNERSWFELPSLHVRIDKLLVQLSDAQWDGDTERANELTKELTALIAKQEMGEIYDPPF